jgi:hypothetical protein
MRLFAVAVVLGLAVTACHSKSATNEPISSSWSGPTLLSYVPAKTPYVLAVLQPPDAALRARLLGTYARGLREGLAKLDALRSDPHASQTPWMRAFDALEHELAGRDPTQWADALGIDPAGKFVLYGLGVWPVLRLHLTDAARLRTVVERVAAAAAPAVQHQVQAGHPYWTIPVKKGVVVGAVLDDHAVLAFVPAASLPAALPHLLGTQRPQASLRNAQTLPALMSRHRFGPFMVGFLDVRRLFDVIESGGPLHDAITTKLGASLPAACRPDVDRMVALAPRMVFGYDRLDEQGMSARLVLETAPWLTAELAKLRVDVPAAPTSGQALLSMGAAVDVDGLASWVKSAAARVRAHPLSCPQLQELNESIAKLAASFDQQQLPPSLQGLRGATLVIDDMTLIPPNGTGHLAVYGAHVDQLVQKVTALVPFLASLHIPPDGTPVPLPLARFGAPSLPPAHVAMRGDRLVLTLGPDSANRAANQLAAPAHGASPLVTFAFDPNRFADRFGSFLNDTASMRESTYSNIAMVLDVADDGLSVGLSGTWTTPAPAEAAPAQPATPATPAAIAH